jgi:hypothetical protein
VGICEIQKYLNSKIQNKIMVEEKEKVLHLFIKGSDAENLRKLKEFFEDRFVVDTIKRMVGYTLFAIWLYDKKPELYSKLNAEFDKDLNKRHIHLQKVEVKWKEIKARELLDKSE